MEKRVIKNVRTIACPSDITDWICIYWLFPWLHLSFLILNLNLKNIHGTLNTEIRLCKMKLSPSNLCSICKKEPEDIKHLFINCTGIEHIWNWVTNTINSYLLDQETDNQYEIRSASSAKLMGEKLVLNGGFFTVSTRAPQKMVFYFQSGTA